MTQNTCLTCQKPKANLKCGICESGICKSCAQILAEDAFMYWSEKPQSITHTIYCNNCYDEKVSPQLELYSQNMEVAKNVNIYFKTQGKETRNFKRKEKPIQIRDCPDYDEAILRLAYLAAQAGFDTIIDVNMTSKKIITNGYQSTIWNANGIPIRAKQNSSMT